MIPVYQTERLTLRGPRMDDLQAYAAFRASDRVALLGGPYTHAQAYEQLAAIIGQWALRGYGRWMVADKATDDPMGIVGIYHPVDWPEPEIGWSVFEQAEGRGIAQEAARASRAYAYRTLGWTTIMSVIDHRNVRSLALAKRLGCKPSGSFTHPTYGKLDIWRHPAPDQCHSVDPAPVRVS